MILRIQLLIVALLIICKLNGQKLDEHRWQHRILLIETASKTDINYKNQIQELMNLADELTDRKMVIYEIVGNKYKKTDYLASNHNAEWKAASKINLKNRNGVDNFKVTLIGLDGGIKIEKKEVLKKEELFGLIDAMPMRKWELNNKGQRK